MLLFQHNLAGTALQWFARLNLQTVRNWEELSRAFLTQYRHNMDIGVPHITLTQELKRKDESFKEYVIRLRDLASQLETQMSEKEAVRTFIYTLRGIFFDKLYSYVGRNFADVISQGEIIEAGVKSGRLLDPCDNAIENQAESDISFEPLIASQPMQDNQDMDAGTMTDDFVLDQESVNMIREDDTDPRLLIGPPGMVVRGQKAIISGFESSVTVCVIENETIPLWSPFVDKLNNMKGKLDDLHHVVSAVAAHIKEV